MSIQQISEKEFLILYAEIHNLRFPDDKTCGNRSLLEKWMSTLPSGIIRNDSVHAYYSGLESAKTSKTPEIDLSIGNLGALQRWLDNWNEEYKKYPVGIKTQIGSMLVGRVLNSTGLCQIIKDLGWLHAEYERVKGFINDIVKPGPGPDPSP